MPDESCRKCGGILLDYHLCGKCKAATQFMCRICGQLTLERSHEYFCFKIDEEGVRAPRENFQRLLTKVDDLNHERK